MCIGTENARLNVVEEFRSRLKAHHGPGCAHKGHVALQERHGMINAVCLSRMHGYKILGFICHQGSQKDASPPFAGTVSKVVASTAFLINISVNLVVDSLEEGMWLSIFASVGAIVMKG